MSRPNLAQLLTESARKHHAADPKQSKCPSSGALLPESFRTDDVTGETGQKDPDNVGDRPEVTALKAKYANRHLSAVDRILVNRGIDPFEEDYNLHTSEMVLREIRKQSVLGLMKHQHNLPVA